MSQNFDDAQKLGEAAHAKTKAALDGKEVKPSDHHAAAQAHDEASQAYAQSGNAAKANEHQKYADHHRSQMVAAKKPEEKKAKSFAEALDDVTKGLTQPRHWNGKFMIGKITASQVK